MAEEFTVHIDDDLDAKVEDAEGLKDAALQMAERIADIARSTAPVLSGAYAAGIDVQETKYGARVYSSDPKSAWIEFGVPSQGKPAHFNLRRAVDAAGYKFRKK